MAVLPSTSLILIFQSPVIFSGLPAIFWPLVLYLDSATNASGSNNLPVLSSNVSAYLSRVKEPSEKFIMAVYEQFPKSNIIVPRETPNSAPPAGHSPVSLGNIAVTLRELADAVDRIAGISQGVKNEELDNEIDNLNRGMKDVLRTPDKAK